MSISHTVRDCVQILILAQTDTTLGSDVRLELTNILVRLKIWAGNIGVFAADTASVDFRIREDPDLMEVVFSVINKLKHSLQNAVHPPHLEESDHEEAGVDCERHPDSTSSGSSSASLELDPSAEDSSSDDDLQGLGPSSIYIREANNVISRLYRLATVFRKPVSSSEDAKTREFIKSLKEKGEVEELEDVEDHARSHIQAHFPTAPEFLVSRLVEAVVFRRMKIRYRQRHQGNLNQGIEQVFEAPDLCDEEGPESPVVVAASPSHPTSTPSSYRSRDRSQSTPRSVAFSAKNASSINRERIADYASSVALSGITKAATGRRQQLDVVLPPINDGHDKVECPYCLKFISQEETKEPRWTRHVLKDIDPFLCLFKDCEEKSTLFKTADEWLAHMRWQHTIVFCCPAVGHEQYIFDSSEELENHIREEHPETFTESQLPGLIKQGARPVPETLAALNSSLCLEDCRCVICDTLVTQSLHTKTMDYPELEITPEQRMQSHILLHLEAIALLALPHDGDAEEQDSDARQPSPGALEDKQKQVKDLPSAVFEDILAGRTVDKSVPDKDGHDDWRAVVFQKGKSSRVLEPEEDPVIMRLREKGKVSDQNPFVNFQIWVWKHQIIGTDGLGNDARYIAFQDLLEYWQENRIYPILNACSHAIHVPIDDILGRFLRIFSILAYVSTSESAKLFYIRRFVEEAIDDSFLPFTARPDVFSNTNDGIQTFQHFQERQWLFCPVILGHNRLQSKLLPLKMVLPFTVGDKLSGRDGESTIVKTCKVDPSCGLLVDAIVIKEFESWEIETTFKNEVDAYISLENKVPPDIYEQQFLKYYGSFKKGDKAFIMLEYADQGSLLDFFKRNELPLERQEFRELWSNLIDLFVGLEHIHSLHLYSRNSSFGSIRYVHLDLKPANIFVFKKGNDDDFSYRFKIGDFGMSSLALIKTANKSIRTPADPSTKMYGAPEQSSRHAALEDIDYGSLWEMDIWSFGCVLSECLVWMTCGYRGLLAFFRMRQRETDGDQRYKDHSGCFHNGNTRIQAVDDMMNLVLERGRKFDDLSLPIGKLIRRDMLIPSNEHRLEARHLLSRFQKILEAELRSPQHQRLSQEDRAESAAHMNDLAAVSSPNNAPDRTSLCNVQQLGPIPYRQAAYSYQPAAAPSPSLNRMTGRYTSYGSTSVASPSSNAEEYAIVKIPQVLQLIERKKRNEVPEALPDHDRAIREIVDREQIFVIDDSNSMRNEHWDKVVEAVHALGYLVKSADPDGVELFLTSRPERPAKRGAPSQIGSLVRFLKDHRQSPQTGNCNLENSLGPILEHVKRGLKNSKIPKFLQRSRRGTNVYILTDAIWEGGAGVQCGVDEPIKDLVRTMQRLGRTRTTVALQFIQFGNDTLGKQRLQYLDDTLGKELGFDIVDHRHHERDGVWHMLLGSISRGIDQENDFQAEEALT